MWVGERQVEEEGERRGCCVRGLCGWLVECAGGWFGGGRRSRWMDWVAWYGGVVMRRVDVVGWGEFRAED